MLFGGYSREIPTSATAAVGARRTLDPVYVVLIVAVVAAGAVFLWRAIRA
jgi:hypothetical protein